MDHLAGEATGIAIAPIVKKGFAFNGTDVSFVDGWEIRFETLEGSFVYSGQTVVKAVEEAWANSRTWR
jgi:hypothetical protein